MKAKVYNWEGNIVGEIELPAKLFSIPVVPALVHEVMVGIRNSRRVAIAHTKMRGEVRGGGKKPWRQKGTGRARHGSIRSPIWIGGGVVGGPRRTQNFAVKINRKVRQKALAMVLSDKATHNQIIILDTLTIPEAKTKYLARALTVLPVGKKTLLVLPKSDRTVFQASRNLPMLKTITVGELGLLEALQSNSLIMSQETLKVMERVKA